MKNRLQILTGLAAVLLITGQLCAQRRPFRSFTRQDTLRGSITPERAWWDLNYYHLNIEVNPADKTIAGENTIAYTVQKPHQLMQVDLQPPMVITGITQDGQALEFEKDGNVWWVTLKKEQNVGDKNHIVVQYEGTPKESRRPPWDGGISWKKDANGMDFIVSTCQGDGASLWWPCKDHPADEPDSMLISVTVPEYLTDVSNGRLRGTDTHENGTRTFHWFISNPINHYSVNINIGDYVHFGDVYQGEKGPLDCDYWVLKDNLGKAKVHFKEAHRMLEAFEHWFGPYPFYEDSYKLVEVPYPGMEHQSSVTYGNGYANGYGGRDLSGTGWGMKFDFILVHESGHEWFANNISNNDAAEMWVHEAFIAYSENLFLNYFYGKEASADYVIGTRALIRNDRPIAGIRGLNYSGSGDMYYKGSNMLHTLRQIIGDDELWRGILRGLNETFYHQTVHGDQIEDYIIEQSGLDLKSFFQQYVHDYRVPILEYMQKDGALNYRWSSCVRGFNMPVELLLDGKAVKVNPTQRWQQLKLDGPVQTVALDRDYYAALFNLIGNSQAQ